MQAHILDTTINDLIHYIVK